MLGIARLGDPAALQQAFDGFRFWGDIRGVCQVLAFFATVWALAVAVGGVKQSPLTKGPTP